MDFITKKIVEFLSVVICVFVFIVFIFTMISGFAFGTYDTFNLVYDTFSYDKIDPQAQKKIDDQMSGLKIKELSFIPNADSLYLPFKSSMRFNGNVKVKMQSDDVYTYFLDDEFMHYYSDENKIHKKLKQRKCKSLFGFSVGENGSHFKTKNFSKECLTYDEVGNFMLDIVSSVQTNVDYAIEEQTKSYQYLKEREKVLSANNRRDDNLKEIIAK